MPWGWNCFLCYTHLLTAVGFRKPAHAHRCASFHRTCRRGFCNKWKVGGNPAWSPSIGAIFPTAPAPGCLCQAPSGNPPGIILHRSLQQGSRIQGVARPPWSSSRPPTPASTCVSPFLGTRTPPVVSWNTRIWRGEEGHAEMWNLVFHQPNLHCSV